MEKINLSFERSNALSLKQAWLSRRQERFQPGAVKVGWCDEHLHVLARMVDEDIVIVGNPAIKSRIEVGDVFQVFVDRPGHPDYLEIHVTPDNQIQTLAWQPHLLKEFRNGETPLDSILLNETPQPESRTWILKEESSWIAYLKLPFDLLNRELPRDRRETSYKITFCRFDASAETDTPILSSTSDFPHRPLFHQRKFWHTCTFV